MNGRRVSARIFVVLVQAVLVAAALVLLAESLGWHVLSEAGGTTAGFVR